MRQSVSKEKMDSIWGLLPEADLWPPHTCTCAPLSPSYRQKNQSWNLSQSVTGFTSVTLSQPLVHLTTKPYHFHFLNPISVLSTLLYPGHASSFIWTAIAWHSGTPFFLPSFLPNSAHPVARVHCILDHSSGHSLLNDSAGSLLPTVFGLAFNQGSSWGLLWFDSSTL